MAPTKALEASALHANLSTNLQATAGHPMNVSSIWPRAFIPFLYLRMRVMQACRAPLTRVGLDPVQALPFLVSLRDIGA